MTTIHDLLRRSAERHSGKTAVLVDEDCLSYDQLLARSESLAAGFASHGIGPQDRLAIVMDNSMECIVSWLASNVVGCTDVPINPQYRGELLHYLLSDSEVTAVICDEGYRDQIFEVADRLPHLKLIVVNGDAISDQLAGIPQVGLAACETGDGFIEPLQSDERVILYTSGTTGPSKGVIHTQKSMLRLAQYNASVLGYGPDDRLLNFFPLFHQNARYTGVLPAICAGASIRIERRLSTSRFWEICDGDGITAFNYLGSVLRMILNVTGPDRHKGSHSITRAFGAGASPANWIEFEERLGIKLYETYGLSEAPMATINTPGAGRSPPGSAGRASELFEVAIFDERDNPLPARDIGEIVLRPRGNSAFMLGYHNKASETVDANRNLWFHSGDRGYLSEQGELYFEERDKDSIRRRGENISAWEVESVLESHPAIAEAAVYGLPSTDSDEDVAVSIVPSGADTDLAQIDSFAREHLPAYAVPTLVRLVADLPRTATAKVQKEELRRIPREEHSDLTQLRKTSPTPQPSVQD